MRELPMPDPIIFTEADWRVLDSLEVRNLSALKGITEAMNKDIVRELSDGINAGEGMPELSERLQEVVGIGKTRANTMARTETINAAVDGARVRYEQLGVTEFEYIAASDSRTCVECSSRDGKIFKLTDNANLPPIHPNCRCAIAPIVGNRKKEIEEAAAKEKDTVKIPVLKAKPKKTPVKKVIPKKTPPSPAKPSKDIPKNIHIDWINPEKLPNPRIPYPEPAHPKTVIPFETVEPDKIGEAMRQYTGNDYIPINKYNRGIGPELRETNSFVVWTRDMDNEIEGKTLTPRVKRNDGSELALTKIYRGLKGNAGSKYYHASVGDEISDAGFQSWTYKKDFAQSWVSGSSTRTILVEDVKAGTPGYFVGRASSNENEGEIIRARGLIYTVTRRKVIKNANGKPEVYLYVKIKESVE